MVQDAEGADDVLLCDQAGDRSDGSLPVAEAQRREDPSDFGCDSSQDGVVLILDHAEGAVLEAEALQEPDGDGCQQNDGTSTLDEGPAALPGSTEDVAPGGDVVCGQLHNKGSRVTCEELGLLQDDTRADDGSHADEVSGDSHQRRTAEQSTCDEADDGHLSAAGDEAGGHDGHTAVALVLDGTGSHDARDAAARADQHGNEALTGQAELTEDTVHDEGDTGHIADVLQDGQQEEQDQHLGNEAQDRADTGDDAVHDQAVQPARHADALQEAAQRVGDDLTEQDVVGPVGGKGADGPAAVSDGSTHGQGVHQVHDHCEDGQSQNTVGDDLVDLIGNGQVLDAGLLLDSLIDDAIDVCVTLVGDDALGVIVHLSLAVLDVLVDVSDQVGGELQLIHDLVVALKQLDGVPAQEAVIDFALDGLLDVSDGVLDAAGEDVGQLAALASLCSSHSSLCSSLGAFALQCADLNSLTAQLGAQLLQVDLVAVLADEVDHVDSHDHGDAQLDELGGQVQVTLDVGAINDVQDGIGLLLDQISTGDDFFQSVRRQGVDTGQVLDDDILLALQLAFLLLDGNAGPVADVLIRAGQIVEQGSLTTVRVAGQCNFNAHCNSFPLVTIKRLRSFRRRPCARSARSCAQSAPSGRPEVRPCEHRSPHPW